MNRRTTVVLAVLVLAIAGLTACTETHQQKVNDSSDYSNQKPSSPPVTTAPMSEPPVVENPIVPVSDPVDTTSFTQPASVRGWWVGGEPYYAVITIELSQDDWTQFAEQLGLDETVTPAQVQIGGATARSLIDFDALAEEINLHFEKMGGTSLDLRTLETHYDLFVAEL